MRPSEQRLPNRLGGLLAAQALVSLVAALVFAGGESQSLWYTLLLGLAPTVMVLAFLRRVPHALALLLSYCVATVALGGMVLMATMIESVVNVEDWITPSRLVLALQVAVGALLLLALLRVRRRWGGHA